MLKNYAIATLLLLCLTAMAQEPIATDRPDQTETASIVPAGMLQAESGFLHKKTTVHDSEFELPETLLKFGLTDYLELRIITTLFYSKAADSTAFGLQPVTVGLKVNLFKEKGIVPETSLIVHLQLPDVATKKLKSGYLAPEIRLLFQNEVSNTIDLGYNLGVEWDGETSQPEYAYTFSPDFKLSDRLSTYIESFGYIPESHHADHWIDGGFKYLITNNLQVDVSGGYELSSHNTHHQYFESVGLSFRL